MFFSLGISCQRDKHTFEQVDDQRNKKNFIDLAKKGRAYPYAYIASMTRIPFLRCSAI
jgi:hypothetical protein